MALGLRDPRWRAIAGARLRRRTFCDFRLSSLARNCVTCRASSIGSKPCEDRRRFAIHPKTQGLCLKANYIMQEDPLLLRRTAEALRGLHEACEYAASNVAA